MTLVVRGILGSLLILRQRQRPLSYNAGHSTLPFALGKTCLRTVVLRSHLRRGELSCSKNSRNSQCGAVFWIWPLASSSARRSERSFLLLWTTSSCRLWASFLEKWTFPTCSSI